MGTWPLEAEREFWRHACTPGTSPHSLWWFCRIAWGTEWYFKRTGKTRWLVARVHKPWLAWYQKHLLEWLKRRQSGTIGRLYTLTIVLRNAGKTLLITRAANLWLHLADRNVALYIGSETHPKAKTFLSSIKGVASGEDENAWFTWLYGNFRHKQRAWSAESVVTAYRTAMSLQEPTFGTYGLEVGITGMHPDGVVLDDPSSLETLSPITLQAARDSYDSIHPALRTDSFFSGVMTRYAENDAAGHILNQEGIASWSGMPNPDPQADPSKYTGKVHVYFLQGRDRSKKSDAHPKGEPVIPEVWDEDGLSHYELKDPINYAAQIMQTPTVGEHMPLEDAQLQRMLISRDDVPVSMIDFATLHLDTAFKDEERIAKGDYNVCAGVLHDIRNNGRVYIDRIVRNKTDRPEQFISKIVAYLMSLRARGIRVKRITDENELSGKAGTFKQLLTVSLQMAGFRIGPDTIVTYNRTAKKASRLRKAAAYWAEGYVRIIRGIEEEQRIIYEMVHLDKGDHDDIADALSDVWQAEVWKKPYREAGARDTTPTQPGDEVLRPALLTEADRIRRRAEYDPAYSQEREYRDDPV